MKALNATAKLLRDLIAIPSVNPAFTRAADTAISGESRVAAHLAELAAKAGLEVEQQEVFPGRHNLLCRLSPAQKTRRRVLLAPHMDTVGGHESNKNIFNPRVVSGKLHGRGACDTKGSVAAMFSALTALAASGVRPRSTEIVFTALVDEENGQTGSRALVKSRLKADLAIVGEPTGCRVVTAHKGDLWLELVTRGRAAHGAKPHLGSNAVHAMARIVCWLETDYAAELRTRSHPVLGSPTINVGSIAGGRQPNIVPDHCVISMDRRTIPGETEASVRRELKQFIRASGISATLANSKGADCLPMETSVDLPLVREFMQLAGQSSLLGVDFFCDASVLSAGGMPSVVFGPGDIAQAHTADEWISLNSLDEAAALLERFLRGLS